MFELAKQCDNWGVGCKFAKRTWEGLPESETYWTITKIKTKPTGRSGAVWGALTWKGKKKEVEKIPGSMKTDRWKIVPENRELFGPTLVAPPRFALEAAAAETAYAAAKAAEKEKQQEGQ